MTRSSEDGAEPTTYEDLLVDTEFGTRYRLLEINKSGETAGDE